MRQLFLISILMLAILTSFLLFQEISKLKNELIINYHDDVSNIVDDIVICLEDKEKWDLSSDVNDFKSLIIYLNRFHELYNSNARLKCSMLDGMEYKLYDVNESYSIKNLIDILSVGLTVNTNIVSSAPFDEDRQIDDEEMEYLRRVHKFFASLKTQLDNIDINESDKNVLKDLENIFNQIEGEYGLSSLAEEQSIN